MIDLRRLAVLVSPEDADIEIVARVFEIIRIAAVKRDLLFRSKHQSDVIVSLVAVKMIQPALIERNDIRPQSGLLLTFLLDGCNGGGPGRASLRWRRVRLNGSVYAVGHILDRDEDI